jgi:hypothetical protein
MHMKTVIRYNIIRNSYIVLLLTKTVVLVV